MNAEKTPQESDEIARLATEEDVEAHGMSDSDLADGAVFCLLEGEGKPVMGVLDVMMSCAA
jgi:hypothetical protein